MDEGRKCREFLTKPLEQHGECAGGGRDVPNPEIVLFETQEPCHTMDSEPQQEVNLDLSMGSGQPRTNAEQGG